MNSPRAPYLRTVAASAVAVGLAVSGFVYVRNREPPPPPPTVAPARNDATSTWPKGAVSRYRVDWRTRSEAILAVEKEPLVGTELHLAGELAVRSHGERDDALLLGMRFTQLADVRIEAVGRPIETPKELGPQLLTGDVVVALERTGNVRDFRFSPETTPLVRGLLRSLVLEVTAELAGISGQLDVVDTALGRARVERRRDGGTISTQRLRYDELEALPDGFDGASGNLVSGGGVELDESGGVRRVHSTEDMLVRHVVGPIEGFRSKTTLSLDLLSRSRVELGPTPDYAPSGIRETRDAHAVDRKAVLARRSRGVTFESIVSDLRMASLLPRSGPTDWVAKDSAFLELHPELSARLLDHAGRSFELSAQAAAIDVVVISGTAEGQRALVAAFDAWGRRSDEVYVILVQRFGYLHHPTAATLSFIGDECARHTGKDPGRACRFALGALAAAVAQDDPPRAEAIASKLVTELRGAKHDDDREALVRSLGNAGLTSTVPAILANKRSNSVPVRLAVAASLRRMEGRAVVDTLLEYVRDPSTEVASVALGSLFRQELDETDWQSLEKAVVDGQLPEGAHDTLVNALSGQKGASPHVAAILVAMLASPRVAPRVKVRIESVLRD